MCRWEAGEGLNLSSLTGQRVEKNTELQDRERNGHHNVDQRRGVGGNASLLLHKQLP